MKKTFSIFIMTLCMLAAPMGVNAQTLVFHLTGGAKSTVALPATFTVTPTGDKLVIDGGGSVVELPKDDVMCVTYRGKKGDVNEDETVDVADIATIISIMAGGGEPAVSLDVSSASLSFESSADSKQVKVACNGSWAASSSQSWCTVSPVSGTGDGTLTITVSENTNGESRSATVTVKAGTFTKTLNVTQEGKALSYTSCPDGNHPHMIDLGLPSGTKWACCNVGASTPEEYGNYYAWGETSPKNVYNEATYKYYQNGSYVNIGSDIAGTGYDAATANWGSPWRMPSLSQIEELLDNTTSARTTQNGVNGRKFTGSNGGAVFLPAAGVRGDGELSLAGSYGYYWSSTPYGEGSGYYLRFGSGYADWYYYSLRYFGRSVRPVR